MFYPPMFKVRQNFDSPSICDVPAAVRQTLNEAGFASRVHPGESIAICCGSRGIASLPAITAEVVAYFSQLGLRVTIVPAMGSHGNATAEGQREILAGLGITEASMGVPVVSDMDVVSFGHLDLGAEVFFAKSLLEYDHIFPVNRVKPHTAFRGRVESGLCKMLAVGCGKHQGASNMHKYDLSKTLAPAASLIIEHAPVLGGLAIVENAHEKTYLVRAVTRDNFVESDAELLQIAWTQFPRLPFNDLDLLILDEMGKNISGAGMDPNVIGLWRREGGERNPDFRTLTVLSLTPESHGNAMGVGMADFIPQSLRDDIDMEAMYMNALTAGVWRAARLPVTLPTEESIMQTALGSVPDGRIPRVARVRSTLMLEELWVSEPVLDELRNTAGVVLEGGPSQWGFDSQKRLLAFSL